MVRNGGLELPDWPLSRGHLQLAAGDSLEPGQSLPGAQRWRLQEPGRRSPVHRTALSRYQRRNSVSARPVASLAGYSLADSVSMQNYSNSAGPRAIKVVAMGGGTGLSTLLHGLKQYVTAGGEVSSPGTLPHIDDLSAIVTVSDDGGSSGRLRKELNVPAPGDVRNCIVALSEDEALLSRLFQYRFPAGEGLGGHSFGNLF